MHVLFVERHGLEETEIPTDLDQSGADLVVLSFSDSDLGAFAEGWHRGYALQGDDFPTLRLANLAALKHPVSVDTYIEKTLSSAKGILVRLIGGTPYWSYGLQQVEKLARQNKIAFAVLPADGRDDPQLDAVVHSAGLHAAPSAAFVRDGRRGRGSCGSGPAGTGGRAVCRTGDRQQANRQRRGLDT